MPLARRAGGAVPRAGGERVRLGVPQRVQDAHAGLLHRRGGAAAHHGAQLRDVRVPVCLWGHAQARLGR
eukprot:1182303-Prorocentrum_minimum.AAC.1